jgi:hypothetical protein
MPLALSGRLTTPFGDPLPNAVIRLDAVRTSGAVLSYTNAEAATDNGGDYAISVEYGTYDIRVKTSQSFYTLATSVQINSDNTEQDLNALLVAHTGYEALTPQIILDFQALRDEALAAQQSASADAEQTALDRVATGEDRQQTGLDRVATGEDAAATAADRVATGEDRQAVAADLEQTGLDRVATGEDAAATAADRIATGEDADATAADRLATGEDRTAAAESALEAKHWANYPIDTPVPEGDGTELSGRHWAEIARQRAVNAMVAQGAWDASTGSLPAEPAGASYWLVTGAANGVTINSVEYRNKDMLLWTPGDGGGGSWSKIDNTDSVASVAGKTGAVDLTPADAGADPAGTATTKVAEHEAKSNAHTPAQVGADPAGTASAAVTAHEEKASAHTPAQVGADPAGTASAAVTAHEEKASAHTPAQVGADPAGTAVAVTPSGFTKSDSSQPAWVAPTSTTLETASDLVIIVASTIINVDASTAIVLPTLSNGTDYTIYALADGSLEAVDADDLAPADSRAVGGFHVFLTGEIAERSLWDLSWRPVAPSPRAMVHDPKCGIWADIYLMDTEYGLNGYSRNSAQIAVDGSEPVIPDAYGGNGSNVYGSMSWWVAVDIASAAGKRLPFYNEFTSIAYGVVERQSVGTYPATTQHQAGHRSAIGCEQVTGAMYQWGADISATTATTWQDIAEGRGNIFADNIKSVRLGGNAVSTSNSGSRASLWNASPDTSGISDTARGVCSHLNLQAGE